MENRTAAGALGPRLVGRLTAELILRSPQYMNCVNLYELDLRGNKVGAIENLGATENQFDSIDLSDNAVVLLDGFPRLLRLKALLLNNNRIIRIGRQLYEAVPNLEVLVLTNNKLAQLKDLDPLSTLKKLRILSLLENPVTKQPNYRVYVINKIPSLKVLDYRKVKLKEVKEAGRLYAEAAPVVATFEPEEDLAAEKSNLQAAEPAEEAPVKASAPTPAQLTAIKAAIANAATLEEVRRLEAALTTGHLPSELQFNPTSNGTAVTNGDVEMTDS